MKRQVYIKMRRMLKMFIAAVFALFLIKLRWPKNKSLWIRGYFNSFIYIQKQAKFVNQGHSGPIHTSCFCRAELNSRHKHGRSTKSKSKFFIWCGRTIKFDKVCRATRLWHGGSDSNVVLMPCPT